MENPSLPPLSTPSKKYSYTKIFFLISLIIIFIVPIIFFISSIYDIRLKNEDPFNNDVVIAKIVDTDSVNNELSDTIRIRDINIIGKKIQDALLRKVNLPLPENALDVAFGERKMGYQGAAGKELFDALGLDFLRDPVSNDMYYYLFNPSTKDYQILALLDKVAEGSILINGKPAYTVGTSDRQFLLTSSGDLAVSVIRKAQKITLGDPASLELLGLEPFRSCKDIQKYSQNLKSGKYTIKYKGKPLLVYCDMKIDGGGWTLFYANSSRPNFGTGKSYVSMRDSLFANDTNIDSFIFDNDNDTNGLLDYLYFIQQGAKEILSLDQQKQDKQFWLKFTFSSSDALKWALGEAVLGNENSEGCLILPNNDSWNITRKGKVIHEKLSYLSNNGGKAWGVSDNASPCNGYLKNYSNAIGFFDALGKNKNLDYDYRYFIR